MFIALAFLACIAGNFAVAPCMFGIRRLSLSKKYLKENVQTLWGSWSVFFIGATERCVALALVLWAPPYLPAFVGGWVLLKFSLGWLRVKDGGEEARTDSMLSLIGSVLSFAIAVLLGVALNRHAIDVWATAPK